MNFEVNTDILNANTVKMKQRLEAIKGDVNNMYQALEALEGTWDGTAHDAFRKQYQQDHSMMNNLLTELNQVVSGIDTARKNYVKCEQEAIHLANSIQI